MGSRPRILSEYLDVTDFELAARWAVKHGKADYMWSKEAVCAYVARQAFPLLKRGIPDQRHLPRSYRHPPRSGQCGDMARLWRRLLRRAGISSRPRPWSRRTHWPSCAATLLPALNGVTLISDVGYISSGITGSYPSATPVAQFLTGKLR